MSKPYKEFDTTIQGPPPISRIDVTEDNKVDVLTQYWMSLRQRIGVWEDRAYAATVWSLGLIFSAMGYCLLQPQNLTATSRILIASAFVIFGGLTQAFLSVARRSYRSTGAAIDRVQAALRLCEPDVYVAEKPFFGYTGRYLPPRIMTVLQCLHIVGLLFALGVVLFVH